MEIGELQMKFNLNMVIEEDQRTFTYYITSDSGKCYYSKWPKPVGNSNSEVIARWFASELSCKEYGCGYYKELKEVIDKLLTVGYRKMNLDKDFCYK